MKQRNIHKSSKRDTNEVQTLHTIKNEQGESTKTTKAINQQNQTHIKQYVQTKDKTTHTN